MSPARRHRLADLHRDGNEATLLLVAEALGGHWWAGPPLDGYIYKRGVCLGPVEIKIPEREGATREFTPSQKRFIRWCQVNEIRWHVWRTEEDVIRTLGGRVSA